MISSLYVDHHLLSMTSHVGGHNGRSNPGFRWGDLHGRPGVGWSPCSLALLHSYVNIIRPPPPKGYRSNCNQVAHSVTHYLLPPKLFVETSKDIGVTS